jgi:predicted ATPase/class 3 adenylate cyclase
MSDAKGELPAGTVTFLFSDIEGSTDLVQQLGDAWPEVLEAHRQILRAAFARHSGVERGTEGDSFFVAFDEASAAVAAAAEAQLGLAARQSAGGADLRVRIGLHSGAARLSGSDYVGMDVHRAARIAAAGYGGQVLVSDSTRALAERSLPAEVSLQDLGEHRLKDLPEPEHLFQLVIAGLPSEFPPIRSLEAAGNIPVPLSSFVGRQAEMEEVRRLLGQSRLLTLVGPGGVGKTRLLVEVARGAANQFRDGVWFAGLAPITDPKQVASTIASAAGVRETGTKTAEAVLADHFRLRTSLLLLDNFERVLSAAPLVAELLSAAAGLTIVATSQVPLRVSGEQVYRVPPLSLTGSPESPAASDAGRLFIDRALHVRPDFRITADTAATIVQICGRLDGLPLAIELAAARVRLLDVGAILERLDNRLALLSSGPSDAPDRHRTLRAAIAWTHELLGPSEAVVFRRLSAFVGGASLAAIEHVCSETPTDDAFSALDELVGHSLVLAETGTPDPRFHMLETIRAFAVERLEESTEEASVRRRHAEYYRDAVERLAPAARLDPSATDVLAPEVDNIGAALRWAADAGERDLGLRICGSGWRLWGQRGLVRTGLAWTESFLGMPQESGDPFRMGALEAAGGLAYWLGEGQLSLTFYRERLAEAERYGTPTDVADARMDLSFGFANIGDAEAARQAWAEAYSGYAALEDVVGLARCRWVESSFNLMAQRFTEARAGLVAIIPIFREHGDYNFLGLATGSLAMCEVVLGNLAAAEYLFSDALLQARGRAGVVGVIIGLGPLAKLWELVGRPEEGARLTGAFEALSTTYGVQMPAPLVQMLEIVEKRMRPTDELDPDVRQRLVAAGRQMTPDQVLEYASSGRGNSP